MELWIRSQNRLILAKIKNIVIDYNDRTKILGNNYMFGEQYEDYIELGRYDTEERALEVLDDIQKQIRNTLILSISPLMTYKGQHELLEHYKKEFDREFILETRTAEVKPLNSEIVLYEMPKE